jgi:apolipoprotein N-acyltransferase
MTRAAPLPLALPLWQRLVLLGVIGVALRAMVGLEPAWWLAWLAALIGTSANFAFYKLAMPLPFALLVVVLQALIWFLVIMSARRVVLRFGAWWTVFAYPLLWATADMLMAYGLPDGNWGAMAYSQANFLPALQLTSLFGTAGLVFMLSLVASAAAMPLAFGATLPHAWRAYGVSALALVATLAYGITRLQTSPAPGQAVVFGLAVIDDYIGPNTPPATAAAVWAQYDVHVTTLAQQGAQVILLPEKIAVLTPGDAKTKQRHFEQLAAQHKVWIEVGVGVDDGGRRTNLAWLVSPQGTLVQNYQKHHMAPPEREFIPGHDYNLQALAGVDMGLAVCKDMHFARLGRANGVRGADVMLVPAWDFKLDGPLATGITLTRGVENGYAVVRPSREGLLTVSDAYGRILASRPSATMPGSTLLTKLEIAPQTATLYTRIGDLFGWLCVALAALLLAATLRPARVS